MSKIKVTMRDKRRSSTTLPHPWVRQYSLRSKGRTTVLDAEAPF